MDPAARRDLLLTAAAELFENEPYDQLTIERFAEECGASVGLIYHYFGNKRGLYLAFVQRALEEMIDAVQDPGPQLALDERFRRALIAYIDFITERPRSYVAVLNAGVGTDPEVARLLHAARGHFERLIAEALGAPVGEPRLAVAIGGWIGLLERTCSRWLAEPTVSRDELREFLVHSALAVIAPIANAAE